jgi:hypothetical protein
MAQATVELRNLLTTNFKLFDFDYQFDDLSFKAQLEQTIIDYYYDHEIGFETPDMFKRRFKARWNRIISYYNQLYNTTLLEYNPLVNYKLEEVLDQLAATSTTQTTDMANTNTGTNTVHGSTVIAQDVIGNNTRNNTQTNNLTETTNGTNSTNVNSTDSDYPQQPIAGGSYASGAKVENSDGTTSSTTTNTGTVKNDLTEALDTRTDNTTTVDNTTTLDLAATNTGTVANNGTINTDYTKTIEGITGITYPELIEKHRSVLLRISDRIIEEMKPCFILVY